jgi:hypothetical protein
VRGIEVGRRIVVRAARRALGIGSGGGGDCGSRRRGRVPLTGRSRGGRLLVARVVLVFAVVVVGVVTTSMRVGGHGLLTGLTHGLLRVGCHLRWRRCGVGRILTGIVAIGRGAVAGRGRSGRLGARRPTRARRTAGRRGRGVGTAMSATVRLMSSEGLTHPMAVASY